MRKSSEFAEAAKALAEARRALERKIAEDPRVEAARQAATAAEAAVRSAVDAQVSATPEGKALLADMQKLRDTLNDQEFEARLNKILLNEYSNHLFGNDPELRGLRERAERAERALQEVHRAERDAEAAAGRVHEAAARARTGSPAARPTENSASVQFSPRGPATPENADEQAIKAYADQLTARQTQNRTTADLLRRGDADAQAVNDTLAKLNDLTRKFNEARAKAYQDEKVSQASQAARTASEGLHMAIASAAGPEVEAVDAALKAFNAQHDAGRAANPNAVESPK
jgi:hypothetical protein